MNREKILYMYHMIHDYVKHTTRNKHMTLTNHVYWDELRQKHTSMSHRSIFTSYADEEAGRRSYSKLTSWLRQKQPSPAVLTPPPPRPPFTAKSNKYSERNLERSENSVGEWQHSVASAGKNKPKTSNHVWVDYTFATSQGNRVEEGKVGGAE